jgi:predicted site-specific integrase-resolvase
MSEAGDKCGVDRKTIARWVKEGRLTTTEQRLVGNLMATFVDTAEVKREAGKIKAGRPRADGRRR